MLKSWGEYYKQRLKNKDLFSYYKYKIASNIKLIKLIERYTKKTNNNLLEAGAGTGLLSIYFKKKGYNCTCLDNDRSILDIAKEFSKIFCVNNEFIFLDIRKTSFKDREFGVSFNLGVMEHFDDIGAVIAINEQIRIAEYFIFSIPSINTGATSSQFYGNERYLSAADWERIIENSQADIVLKRGYNFSHNKVYGILNYFLPLFYNKADFLVYVLRRR